MRLVGFVVHKLLSLILVGICDVGIAAKPNNFQSTVGLFQKLEFGDYLYLNVLDDSGKKQTFYCNLPKCADWESAQASFEEKRVVVKWAYEEFFFKEAKTKKKIRAVQSLDLIE